MTNFALCAQRHKMISQNGPTTVYKYGTTYVGVTSKHTLANLEKDTTCQLYGASLEWWVTKLRYYLPLVNYSTPEYRHDHTAKNRNTQKQLPATYGVFHINLLTFLLAPQWKYCSNSFTLDEFMGLTTGSQLDWYWDFKLWCNVTEHWAARSWWYFHSELEV